MDGRIQASVDYIHYNEKHREPRAADLILLIR